MNTGNGDDPRYPRYPSSSAATTQSLPSMMDPAWLQLNQPPGSSLASRASSNPTQQPFSSSLPRSSQEPQYNAYGRAPSSSTDYPNAYGQQSSPLAFPQQPAYQSQQPIGSSNRSFSSRPPAANYPQGFGSGYASSLSNNDPSSPRTFGRQQYTFAALQQPAYPGQQIYGPNNPGGAFSSRLPDSPATYGQHSQSQPGQPAIPASYQASSPSTTRRSASDMPPPSPTSQRPSSSPTSKRKAVPPAARQSVNLDFPDPETEAKKAKKTTEATEAKDSQQSEITVTGRKISIGGPQGQWSFEIRDPSGQCLRRDIVGKEPLRDAWKDCTGHERPSEPLVQILTNSLSGGSKSVHFSHTSRGWRKVNDLDTAGAKFEVWDITTVRLPKKNEMGGLGDYCHTIKRRSGGNEKPVSGYRASLVIAVQRAVKDIGTELRVEPPSESQIARFAENAGVGASTLKVSKYDWDLCAERASGTIRPRKTYKK